MRLVFDSWIGWNKAATVSTLNHSIHGFLLENHIECYSLKNGKDMNQITKKKTEEQRGGKRSIQEVVMEGKTRNITGLAT